jgi:integrase
MTRRGNRESWMPDHPNARGYWEASVWMGVKASGKPDRRHVERKTRASRNKAVRELERQRDAGTRRPSRAPTVGQVVTRHLTVVLPQRGRAPRTIADYWSKYRNDIAPRWAATRVDQLHPDDIEDGYAQMLAAGHAPAHVLKVHAILSSVLAIQAKRGVIPRNPCDLVEAPAIPLAEKKALSGEQARAVLAAIEGRPSAARWKTGLVTGMRQGEVLGLRWDYAGEAEFRVWWQLQRLTWQHGCFEHPCGRKRAAECPHRYLPPGAQPVSGALVLREIKERRRKTVPAGELLAAVLREHRAAQAAARLAAGPLWQDLGFVFCQPDGRPIDPRADWQEWHDILEQAGILHVGVHGGRHTAASLAVSEGISVAVVKELLGHGDIRVTEGYVEVSSPQAHAAARRLGRALLGPANAPARRRTATKTATTRPG